MLVVRRVARQAVDRRVPCNRTLALRSSRRRHLIRWVLDRREPGRAQLRRRGSCSASPKTATQVFSAEPELAASTSLRESRRPFSPPEFASAKAVVKSPAPEEWLGACAWGCEREAGRRLVRAGP